MPTPTKRAVDAHQFEQLQIHQEEGEDLARECEAVHLEYAETQHRANCLKERHEQLLKRLVAHARAMRPPNIVFIRGGTDGEDWRGAPVDDLMPHGLPASMACKLSVMGINTLGKLRNHQPDALADIRGVGKKGAAQIMDAFHKWMDANPDRCAEC